MGLFAFVWGQTRHTDRLSRIHHECYLGIQKPEEFLIFLFHIVVHLEMYMDESISLTLYHTTQEMLECLDILAMHTDEEGTIRGLDSDIDILSYGLDRDTRSSDPESSPEPRNKGKEYIFHKNNKKLLLKVYRKTQKMEVFFVIDNYYT